VLPGLVLSLKKVHAMSAQSATVVASPVDRAFIGLQNAYRPHGGLSRLSSLAAAARRVRGDVPDRDVAAHVASGEVFAFEWYGNLWLPLFQFDAGGSMVAAGPQRVVQELGRGFDAWALAGWFARANTSLAGRSPVQCLTSALPAVLLAAREDRFLRSG
jgi:hypothetical protein